MNSITHNPLTNSQPGLANNLAGVASWIDRAYGRWQQRAAEQRELAAMTERDLRDARLTRWDVEQEMAKPFWRG